MQTLVVQRGHVLRTTGATGTAGEQEVVTAIAAEMVPLTPPGWTLRIIDADPPDRLYRGDVFVALHCDGSTSTSTSGASVGYPDAAGKALAERWKAAYASQGWSRGFKPDNYTAGLRGYYAYDNALREGNRVRCVIEHGFLTNKSDAAWIRANIDKCAAAVWIAVAGKVGSVTDTPYYIVTSIFPTSELALGYAAWCTARVISTRVSGAAVIAHGNDGKSRNAEAEAEKRGAVCPFGRILTTQTSYRHFRARTPYVPAAPEAPWAITGQDSTTITLGRKQ